MKGFIVFPPVHDFAMPYLAGPLLKGYIEQNDPDIEITCVDLNLSFFKYIIRNYSNLLIGYRGALETPSLVDSVGGVIAYQNQALNELEKQSQNYDGHGWSLRNYKSPFNRKLFSECILYSESNTPYDDLYLEFLSFHSKPDFFSVSLTVEDQILPTFRLLNLSRKHWPNIPIILGGNLMNRIGQFMDRDKLNQLCDFVILREGEEPFLNLLRWLRGFGNSPEIDPRIIDLSLSKIPALGLLDTLPKSVHTSLDIDFKPDFTDLDIFEYLSPMPILPILFSRKCYWGRCSFCTIHSAWDPSHRRRKPEEIYQEFDQAAKKYDMRYFRIVDEACPPDLLLDVSDLILQNSLDLRYEIYGILEKRFVDKNVINKLSSSGCRQIFWGLESRDARTIKNMSKGIIRLNELDQIFASTAKNGIHNYTFTMYGFPGQDMNAQNKTVEYIIGQKNIHTAVVSNFSAELESPYAKDNPDLFIHSGELTEKYSEYYSNGQKLSAIEIGVKDAKRAQNELYLRRPDLAITALLKEETRLVLSDKFGPDFARQFLALKPHFTLDIDKVMKIASDERIHRELT